MSTTSHWVSPVYGTLVLFSENVYFSTLAFSRTPQILAMCSHHITAPPLQPADADCSAGPAPLLHHLGLWGLWGCWVSRISQDEEIPLFFPQEEWLPKWAAEKTYLCWLNSTFSKVISPLHGRASLQTAHIVPYWLDAHFLGKGWGLAVILWCHTHLWPLSYQYCHTLMLSRPAG